MKILEFTKSNLSHFYLKSRRHGIVTIVRELIADGYKNISKSSVTTQYERPWLVHFDEPTKDYRHTISYIGRYTKKPPIAMSKIIDFTGNHVTHIIWSRSSEMYRMRQSISCRRALHR